MKRKAAAVLLTVIILQLFPVFSSALTTADDYSYIYDTVDSSSKELLRQAGVDEIDFDSLISLSPSKILTVLGELLKNNISAPLKSCVCLSCVLIIFSTVRPFADGRLADDGCYGFIESSVLAVSVTLPLSQALSGAAAAIVCVSDFMLAYIPVFTAYLSAGGQPLSSVLYASSLMGFAQLLNIFAMKLYLPLIGVMTAVNIFSSLTSRLNGTKLTKALKKILTVTLSTAAALFVAMTNMRTDLAYSADSLAIKGIKLASGGFVPVIGSALSEAVNSAIGAMALIKSTVGAFGVVAVILIFAPSIIQLLAWYLCLSICSVGAEALGMKTSCGVIESLLESISAVNIILVLCALIFILTTGNLISVRG